MLTFIIEFFMWTLCLYIIHRLIHVTPFLRRIHYDHHRYINLNNNTKWHWNNLFLFNDTWISTLDLWIGEVIPTLMFSYITGNWWIFVFYYLWAALVQETLEHNKNLDWYPLTSGKWHLLHHKYPDTNFGLFLPIWDKVFKTYRSV